MSSAPLQLDSKTTATREPRRASNRNTPLTTVGKSLQRGFSNGQGDG